MRKYLVFSVITLPLFLAHVNSTAIAVAFPSMVSHFETSLVLAGWVLTIYQLVLIAAIPVVSRLSDILGRRSIFMLCLILFTGGSLFAALAPNIALLILFRGVQGAGAGGFVAAASGIVADEFPEMRQRFIGLFSSIGPFGSLVGPAIGAFMVTWLGWQSVLWVNVPLGIINLLLAWYMIKADVKKTMRGGLDLVSVFLLTSFVAGLMISLTMMDESYDIPMVFVGLVALLAVFFFVMFIQRSRTHPNGVVSMDLLKRRPFLAANIYNFAFGASAQAGVMSLMPLFGAAIYGMSVVESGLMIIPRSLGMMIMSTLASFYIIKWGYRRPIVLGTAGVAFGLLVLAFKPGGLSLGAMVVSPVYVVAFFALIAGIGAGLASPASNNSCIELMPDKVASITGLRQVTRQMGGALSISVATLVLELSPDMATGFTIVFLASGALALISIPAAYYMPKGPVPEARSEAPATVDLKAG